MNFLRWLFNSYPPVEPAAVGQVWCSTKNGQYIKVHHVKAFMTGGHSVHVDFNHDPRVPSEVPPRPPLLEAVYDWPRFVRDNFLVLI